MTNDAADHFVRVRGASEHNLRHVDVDIPRDAMVAFTGVSGSGKSSLAFGTLYAEAQRRYFESVAPYARRLLQQVGAPHVQEITGLPPAVALQQRRGAPSSRSTVGTITTLSNLLRMLYSRAGTYPPRTAAAGRRGVLAQHRGRRLPALPRTGCRARRHRGAARPGHVAEHPRRRDRGLAGGLAGRQPAQHRDRSGDRRRQAVAQAPEEGPGLAALHRRAAVRPDQARARPHRPRLPREVLERPQARHACPRRLQEPADARPGDAVRPERALPRVPRQRTAAGGARGDLRGPLHRRGQRAAAHRGRGAAAARRGRCPGRMRPRRARCPERRPRSRSGSAPTWSRASRCCSTSVWATSASGAARRRCRPARRSACGSPPSCARGCSAWSTCSTSPPRACTRPTRSRCWTCWTA